MSPAYLPVFVVAGIALDWAFFEQMRTTISIFRPEAANFAYRDYFWPRAVLTIVGSGIVGIGALFPIPNVALTVTGSGMFLASHFYADYLMWRNSRPD